jgi:hypothetical protein
MEGYEKQKDEDHKKGKDIEGAITGYKRLGTAASTNAYEDKKTHTFYGNIDILYRNGNELYKASIITNKEQNVTNIIITNETDNKNCDENQLIDHD